MPLKYTIKTLDEIPEAIRPLYVEDKDYPGGAVFRLAVDGIEDPAELRRAKQREADARKAAEAKVKEMETAQAAAAEAARLAAEEAARKSGKIEELDKSWQQKLATQLAEVEGKYKPVVDSLQSDVNRLLIDNVAQQIASAIAIPGSDVVLMPHIKQRLRVEERDGKRVTVVVNVDGTASALTTQELQKEFQGNKAFAPMIVGSKASGGGANGGKGGGAADNKTITRSEFEQIPAGERSAFFKGGGKVVDSATT